ncbi:MAG: PKD domain-containing protein [Polaribacter sp.]
MSTNKKMSNHIDKSVTRFFIIAFLISASVLGYKATRYSPCKEVEFSIKTKEFVEGKLIKFVDNTSNATSWAWNFGDGSKDITNKEALHIYKSPGEYNVSLLVNGICQEVRKVVIKEKEFMIDSTKLAVFHLPASIRVGKKLVVVDKTPNASTWEWRFGETAGANSTKKLAKYVYETPGLKTVSLVVNGDIKHATSKKIQVLRKRSTIRTLGRPINDAPTFDPLEEDMFPEEEVPYITEKQFKYNLNLVARKKSNVSTFKKYLCGDLKKSIIVNGKRTTFSELCELIAIKKLKIKEVKLYREDDSNCITDIAIRRSRYIL